MVATRLPGRRTCQCTGLDLLIQGSRLLHRFYAQFISEDSTAGVILGECCGALPTMRQQNHLILVGRFAPRIQRQQPSGSRQPQSHSALVNTLPSQHEEPIDCHCLQVLALQEDPILKRWCVAYVEPSEEAIAIQRGSRAEGLQVSRRDRKSTRLNSSHVAISYAVFCLKKKKKNDKIDIK